MGSIGLHMFCVLFGTILLIHFTQAGNCRFPRDWKGRWYQFGLGEVLIRSHSITKKGRCTESHRDYFLLEDTESRDLCQRCLLIMHRHRNIIQYKETYCAVESAGNVFQNLCSQIQVETPLFTLVREPITTPIPAPFEGTYDVDYDDGATGFCSQPQSHAQYCQAKNIYKFKFNHCRPWALWNDKELTFETLATWKDHSDSFMYGLFSGIGIANKDDGYRCFQYERYGPDVYLAMSADATCRGLTSSQTGPYVFKFTKSLSGHRTPQCQFPSWGNDVTWFDLTGTQNYVLSHHHRVLSIQTHNQLHQVEIRSNISCIDKTDEGNDEFTLSVLITEECSERYQCVGYKKLYNGVLGFYTGPPSSQERTASQCSSISANIGSISKQILVSSPVSSGKVRCMKPGMYLLEELSSDCDANIEVGCQSPSAIEVHFSCNKPTIHLECVTGWQDDSETFLLLRDNSDGLINCWKITTVKFNADETIYALDINSCDTKTPPIMPFHFTETVVHRQDCDSNKTWSQKTTPLAPSTSTDKISTIIHTPILISKSTSATSIGKVTEKPTEVQTAKYVLINGGFPSDDEDDQESSADYGYKSEIDSEDSNEIDSNNQYNPDYDRVVHDEGNNNMQKESHIDNNELINKNSASCFILNHFSILVYVTFVLIYPKCSLT